MPHFVSFINPELRALTTEQNITFSKKTSVLRVNNDFQPTSLNPSRIIWETRNSKLSGFRYVHQTQENEIAGTFSLQSFSHASLSGTPLFSTEGSTISFSAPLTIQAPTQDTNPATKLYVDSKFAAAVDINTGTTGQLQVSRIHGFPENGTVFLRGDGAWSSPDLWWTTGQLEISRLAGYPASSNYFLRGDSNWAQIDLAYTYGNLDGYRVSGTVLRASGADNANELYGYTGDFIPKSMRVRVISDVWNSDAPIHIVPNSRYSANWALYCQGVVRAESFSSYSSAKLKHIQGAPPLEELKAKFLSIPFQEYTYKEGHFPRSGPCYGVIAETLADVFPQFVHLDAVEKERVFEVGMILLQKALKDIEEVKLKVDSATRSKKV